MLNRATSHTESGITLVEMMIALGIGTFIITVLITFYGTNVRHSRTNLDLGRLHQEMFLALNLMASDIERAGFWGQAITGLPNTNVANPFTAATTDIQINASNNCLLFSYDRNGDGAIPTVGSSNDERYGYRLINNTIQMRVDSSSYDCAAAASSWETLTDVNVITVTNLTFTRSNNVVDIDGTGPGSATITQRDIVIVLSVQATNDAQMTHTLTRTIKIHNDLYSS